MSGPSGRGGRPSGSLPDRSVWKHLGGGWKHRHYGKLADTLTRALARTLMRAARDCRLLRFWTVLDARMSSARTVRFTPGFLRWRIPVAWLQLAVLYLALPAWQMRGDVDPDFWWHLRTGKLIFDSGIPRHDVFSWTAAGRPWVAHEWLSEAIMYAVESMFGYIGNILVFDAAAIGALVVMYALARRAGAGTRVLFLLMLLSVVMLSYAAAVRPQLFSWLFFAIFVFLLERDYQRRPVPLWLLPALMALWVNLHLGFVYGLVLVALWAASLACASLHDTTVDLKRPLLIGVGCLAATMLNPHGPDILLYPYRYIEDRDSLRFIN